MTNKFKERLKTDILNTLNGDMMAYEIAGAINPRYNGNINSDTVSQYLKQLRGAG